VVEGKTAVDVCIQHVTQPPRPPSELGVAIAPALEAVLMRCLAKQPSQRHPSAAALAEALEALPPAGDWGKTDALAWWDAFRVSQATGSAASAAPTSTITVDLGARGTRLA
jgi:serine/threonine-protein kinase